MIRLRFARPVLLLVVCLMVVVPAQALAPLKRADVRSFIDTMVRKHRFDAHQLKTWFNSVQWRDDIIAKITRPAEKTKTWFEYQQIFLDRRRIDNGVAFWQQHEQKLLQAERSYGVPAAIIVAILGVETRYGEITGRHGVLEALTTLAFNYPRRSKFFRKELEHYLLLTREERIDPLSLQGSYAGAMGLAQFMPSSYRAYAVDFDSDGRRDLWHNPSDAIGSIANYLSRHRWQRDQPVAMLARVSGQRYRSILSKRLRKPRLNISQLRQRGVIPTAEISAQKRALVFEFQGALGLEYWLGFNNFYVITRYNHSPLYALAVHQLSQAIQLRRRSLGRTDLGRIGQQRAYFNEIL